MKDTEKLINRYQQILREQMDDQNSKNFDSKNTSFQTKSKNSVIKFYKDPKLIAQIQQLVQKPKFRALNKPEKAAAILGTVLHFYEDLPEQEKIALYDNIEYWTATPQDAWEEDLKNYTDAISFAKSLDLEYTENNPDHPNFEFAQDLVDWVESVADQFGISVIFKFYKDPKLIAQVQRLFRNLGFRALNKSERAAAILGTVLNFYKDLPEQEKIALYDEIEYWTATPQEFWERHIEQSKGDAIRFAKSLDLEYTKDNPDHSNFEFAQGLVNWARSVANQFKIFGI